MAAFHHPTCRSVGLALITILACLFSVTASAQVPLGTFSTNRFRPAPGPGNYLQVDGGRVFGETLFGAGLTIDYSHAPFVLFNASCTDDTETNCSIDEQNTELVSYAATANLYASLVLLDRIQIGLGLPLTLSSGEGFAATIRGEAVSLPGGQAFAVGDPELSVKVRLVGDSPDGFHLAAQAHVSAPIANLIAENRFLGDSSLRVGGHFIVDYVKSGFHIALNVGGFWRPEEVLFSTRQGGMLTYRGAIGYEITPLIMLFAEVDGASSFKPDVDEHPLEARLAGRLRFGDFTATLAGGAGLIKGVGVPLFRVAGGFAYSPERGDRDGDGIEDQDDGCPSEAEDKDGWEDEDGCPELDNDGDGLNDDVDPCPIEAEDMDGFEDDNGCPDTDNDKDGVNDGFDSCPNDPEDKDGDRDDDGCPDNDTDRDGIDDVNDRCPNDPEDTDGFGDEDGCPEDDFDGDGILDDDDECPEKPEIINGVADEDGCPEEDADGDTIPDKTDACPNAAETVNANRDNDGCPDGPALAEIKNGQVVMSTGIPFRRNSAELRVRLSRNTIISVARVLNRNRHLRKIRIDSFHKKEKLAKQRADAVIKALVAQGVEAERLTANPKAEDGPERIEIAIVKD